MKTSHAENFLMSLRRSPLRQALGTRVLAALLFLLVATISAILTIERQSARDVFLPNDPRQNAEDREAPFLIKVLPFSDSGLVAGSRTRPQGGENVRLFRLERLRHRGSSLERRSTLTPAFHVCFDCYEVAPNLFQRLLKEKTTPRPIWLFLLSLLN